MVDASTTSLSNGHGSTIEASSSAPMYPIADRDIVAIEHPYIIKNMDKGVQSLGGLTELNTLFINANGAAPEASLYQKPGNRLSKPIRSTNVQTQNVLLKVTVPKRRGLKRKRGSGGHLQVTADDPQPTTKDARFLLRSLKDNSAKYQVSALGTISQTHRFRGLPDFVQSSANSPFMQRMKDHILPFDYQKMKGFKLDMSKGVQHNAEIIPPPEWAHQPIPFNYAYRQNAGVVTERDPSGHLITLNTQVIPKVLMRPIPWNAPVVPTGPAAGLAPISTLESSIQRAIESAKAAMQRRPIFTRRSLANHIPKGDWDAVGQNVNKFIFQYIGYIFSSGPWRDCVVRFGVDPRTDPECRVYQSLMFMLDQEPTTKKLPKPKSAEQELGKESHLFDGKKLGRDGKVWQVCDITDPILSDMLATQNLRKNCHLESDGWYHNGTWAKVRIIMRWKISALLSGTQMLDDEQFVKVASGLPDIIPRRSRAGIQLQYEHTTASERTLAAQIKNASGQSNRESAPQQSARDYYPVSEDENEGNDEEENFEEDDLDNEAYSESVVAKNVIDPAIAVARPNVNDPRVTEALRELEKMDGWQSQTLEHRQGDESEEEVLVDE